MSIKSRSIIFKCYYDIYEKRIRYANKQDKMQSKTELHTSSCSYFSLSCIFNLHPLNQIIDGMKKAPNI